MVSRRKKRKPSINNFLAVLDMDDMTPPPQSKSFQFGFSHSEGEQWKENNTSQHFRHSFGHFIEQLVYWLPKSLLEFYRFRFLLKLSKSSSFSLLLQSTYFASYPAPLRPTSFLELDAQNRMQYSVQASIHVCGSRNATSYCTVCNSVIYASRYNLFFHNS